MTPEFISVIAKVECRSESRGEEKPVAVIIGDDRLEIVEVIDRAAVTGIDAGEPLRHRLWVELEDGRRCELVRVVPDGDWRVNLQRSNV